MENIEYKDSDDAHTVGTHVSVASPSEREVDKPLHAIANNKSRLILHDRIPPTTRHLRDSINATDGNRRKRDDKRGKQPFYPSPLSQVLCCRRQAALILPYSEENVRCHDPEDCERHDLRHEPHHHDVVAGLWGRA